ncbi:MAG: pitrilysin family protein [Myxococcota bacterium]
MVSLAFLLCIAGALPAEAGLDVPLQRFVLRNGLTAILAPDHRLPLVAVEIAFRVGSRDEVKGRTGFAHLFEHLMFMGTKNVPGSQFDEIMEAEGGSNNAETSEDRTVYYEQGPSPLLETFLWLEADRLSSLPEAMTKAKVDLQRSVVKDERRSSYEVQPYGAVELLLPESLFALGHPYHHPVIGSHADLEAASVEDVKSFFRAHYVPSNAALVIAGDFDPAEARRLVERYFAWMPRAPRPPRITPSDLPLEKPYKKALEDAVELDQLTLAWRSPPELGPGSAETEVLAAVLGGQSSSRLRRALVEDRGVAQSVVVEQRGLDAGGSFVIRATAQGGHDQAELSSALDAELARIFSEPPTPAEVDRAKAVLLGRALHAIEAPLGLAQQLAAYELRFGDPWMLTRSLTERYRHVEPSGVLEAAEILHGPRVTITVTPKKKGGPR